MTGWAGEIVQLIAGRLLTEEQIYKLSSQAALFTDIEYSLRLEIQQLEAELNLARVALWEMQREQ